MGLAALEGVSGRRLENIIQEVIGSHKRELVPVHKKVGPSQKSIFELTKPEAATHVDMGDFYEYLGYALLGGTKDVRTKTHDYLWTTEIKPDLMSRKMIAEQKAAKNGSQSHLLDAQITRYHQLQLLHPKKRVCFQYFRHSKQGIRKFEGTRQQLFLELAEKTHYAVELPLSIVTRLWLDGMHGVNQEMVGRFEGHGPSFIKDGKYIDINELSEQEEQEARYNSFQACTLVKSPALNVFFADAKEAIRYLGMNPGCFREEKLVFPSIRVEGVKTKPFPIVRIHDRSHDAWLGYLIRDIMPQRIFSDSDESITELTNKMLKKTRGKSHYSFNSTEYRSPAIGDELSDLGGYAEDDTVPF